MRLALGDKFQFVGVNCECCGIWWTSLSQGIIAAYDIVSEETGVIQRVDADKIQAHIKSGAIILK